MVDMKIIPIASISRFISWHIKAADGVVLDKRIR